MGVDTKGYLNKDITADQILDVICTKFDSNATSHIRIDDYSKRETGFIDFNFGLESRQLFYCVTSDQLQNTEFDSVKHVTLILRHWGSSIEIMNEIIKSFGGYVDENDCDDVDAMYIAKDGDVSQVEYIAERDKLINLLDENLEQALKYQIAAQIMRHKKELKEVL
ncbi:UNVERIFIED_CONTAM: hypothetical protein ABIC26_002713 [Paenibacillus sp. PvR008]